MVTSECRKCAAEYVFVIRFVSALLVAGPGQKLTRLCGNFHATLTLEPTDVKVTPPFAAIFRVCSHVVCKPGRTRRTCSSALPATGNVTLPPVGVSPPWPGGF